MARSKIEWTESSWNPVTGCTKISEGCRHCYAERLAKRLRSMGRANYENGFQLTLHENALEIPLRWTRAQMVFACSMSDLFHEDVPDSFVLKVFKTMHMAKQHCFQVLTKRPERMKNLNTAIEWPTNVWAGVTVESSKYLDRIPHLLDTGVQTKFLSLEPLLSPIADIPLDGIDWVIVGGESGPQSRPMDPQWVKTIRDACVDSSVPFFFKQWGGKNKKKAGRLLEGRTWDGFPQALMIDDQQMPLPA